MTTAEKPIANLATADRRVIIRVNVQLVTPAQAVGAMLALVTAAKPIANPATAAMNPTIIIRVNVQIVTVRILGMLTSHMMT